MWQCGVTTGRGQFLSVHPPKTRRLRELPGLLCLPLPRWPLTSLASMLARLRGPWWLLLASPSLKLAWLIKLGAPCAWLNILQTVQSVQSVHGECREFGNWPQTMVLCPGNWQIMGTMGQQKILSLIIWKIWLATYWGLVRLALRIRNSNCRLAHFNFHRKLNFYVGLCSSLFYLSTSSAFK